MIRWREWQSVEGARWTRAASASGTLETAATTPVLAARSGREEEGPWPHRFGGSSWTHAHNCQLAQSRHFQRFQSRHLSEQLQDSAPYCVFLTQNYSLPFSLHPRNCKYLKFLTKMMINFCRPSLNKNVDWLLSTSDPKKKLKDFSNIFVFR